MAGFFIAFQKKWYLLVILFLIIWLYLFTFNHAAHADFPEDY